MSTEEYSIKIFSEWLLFIISVSTLTGFHRVWLNEKKIVNGTRTFGKFRK